MPELQWGTLVKTPFPSLKHEQTGQTVFFQGQEIAEEKSKVTFNLILAPFTEVICCMVISVK